MNEFNVEYAAGIIDGEGCIALKTYRPSLVIEMCSSEVLEWLHAYYGGNIRHKVGKREIQRDSTVWYVNGPRVISILQDVHPYLVEKKDQALALLGYYDNIRYNQRRTDEDRLYLEYLCKLLKDLKKVNEVRDQSFMRIMGLSKGHEGANVPEPEKIGKLQEIEGFHDFQTSLDFWYRQYGRRIAETAKHMSRTFLFHDDVIYNLGVHANGKLRTHVDIDTMIQLNDDLDDTEDVLEHWGLKQ